jgi:hypothetical protein
MEVCVGSDLAQKGNDQNPEHVSGERLRQICLSFLEIEVRSHGRSFFCVWRNNPTWAWMLTFQDLSLSLSLSLTHTHTHRVRRLRPRGHRDRLPVASKRPEINTSSKWNVWRKFLSIHLRNPARSTISGASRGRYRLLPILQNLPNFCTVCRDLEYHRNRDMSNE